MSNKCPHCGKPPYPIKKEDGTLNWKNLFHVDWMTMIILATVLFSAYAYNHDTMECRKMIADPCPYIDAQQCLNNQMIAQRGGVNESQFYPYLLNQEVN